tara:strand:+ start:188 stop:367 length:180 start_codon:yes stop_codon:yes gene_type:complete
MTETRLRELQTEIARLEELDRKTSDKVAAELDAMECDELQIPCSKDLDMEWANESENIQ